MLSSVLRSARCAVPGRLRGHPGADGAAGRGDPSDRLRPHERGLIRRLTPPTLAGVRLGRSGLPSGFRVALGSAPATTRTARRGLVEHRRRGSYGLTDWLFAGYVRRYNESV